MWLCLVLVDLLFKRVDHYSLHPWTYNLCNKQQHTNTSTLKYATWLSNFCINVFFKIPKAFLATKWLFLCFLLYNNSKMLCYPLFDAIHKGICFSFNKQGWFPLIFIFTSNNQPNWAFLYKLDLWSTRESFTFLGKPTNTLKNLFLISTLICATIEYPFFYGKNKLQDKELKGLEILMWVSSIAPCMFGSPQKCLKSSMTTCIFAPTDQHINLLKSTFTTTMNS